MAYSMLRFYATQSPSKKHWPMIRTIFLFIAAFGIATGIPGAEARPRDREQDEAFRATQEGRFISLRAIESQTLPRMRGFKYIGAELYSNVGLYRLKFMGGGQVIWIDVDARTGREVGRTGF